MPNTETPHAAIGAQIDVTPRPIKLESASRSGLRMGGAGKNPVDAKPKTKPATTPSLSSYATWVNARFPPKMKVVNEPLNEKMDKLISVISENSNAILQLVAQIKVPTDGMSLLIVS